MKAEGTEEAPAAFTRFSPKGGKPGCASSRRSCREDVAEETASMTIRVLRERSIGGGRWNGWIRIGLGSGGSTKRSVTLQESPNEPLESARDGAKESPAWVIGYRAGIDLHGVAHRALVLSANALRAERDFSRSAPPKMLREAWALEVPGPAGSGRIRRGARR
ncbi:hypothetical protein KM043_000874 [Ampulex compressa]|nr:hypothetical protein KM043_000874 [Ampulex compressa]